MWASDEGDYTLDVFVYHNYPRKCKDPKPKGETGILGILLTVIFKKASLNEGILANSSRAFF